MWWAHCNDCQCQYSIYSTRTVNPFSARLLHSPTHSLCLALCGVTMTPPQVGKLTARNKKLLKFLTTVQAIFITIKTKKKCREEEIVIPLLGSVTVQIVHVGERHRDRSWVQLCRRINLIVTINLINYFF